MLNGHDKRAPGLNSMRAGEWERAAELLEPLAAAGDVWAVNDLAVALIQLERIKDAVSWLELPGQEDLPALIRLHRHYALRAEDILSNFNFSWTHRDHDRSLCPERRPAVTVIVRTYNRLDALPEALASLKSQTFTDFETVVVNDGGDMEASAVVRASGLANARYFHAPHGGCWSAMNYGLEMAHGHYITGLDDDDVAYPDHLATLVEALERTHAMAVYPTAKVARVSGQGAGRVFTPGGVRGWTFDHDKLRRTNLVPSVMTMVRRECYETVGRFSAKQPVGGDWEMWLRLSERWPLLHVDKVTAEIREGAVGANLTSRSVQEKYLWDNTFLMMRRALALASEPRDPGAADGYRRALRLLDVLLEEDPTAFNFVNLRGLWEMKKPYAWFADQARWLQSHGMDGHAAAFYRAALKLAPFQPKLWGGLLRTRGGK